MTLQRIRHAAPALALAATLALAAPAHAAGWDSWTVTPGWFEDALRWISHLWAGDGEATELPPPAEKCGSGMDPDGGCGGAVPPPQTPNAASPGGSSEG